MEVIPYKMDEFQAKKILITGASRGIGFAVATLLNQQGAHLLLHASSTQGIERLKEKFGENNLHSYWQADFASPETLDASLKEILPSFGPISAYVNCVGQRVRRPVHMLNVGLMQEAFNTNIISYLEIIRIITRKGIYAEGLSIIGISSIAAHSGSPGVSVYAATKGAVESATRCMARELHHKGIRINAIVSGQVNTEAYREFMSSRESKEDPVLDRQFTGVIDPIQIADLCLFLMSKRSSFISGACLPADGGYLS
jgi:NAD(P)-dependent dehydrogenase (short-subunit alcohol dehydrogenase family)